MTVRVQKYTDISKGRIIQILPIKQWLSSTNIVVIINELLVKVLCRPDLINFWAWEKVYYLLGEIRTTCKLEVNL